VSAIRKTYLMGGSSDAVFGEIRVPMREVVLSNGDSVVLYDTSGPYTDAELRTDVRAGLPNSIDNPLGGIAAHCPEDPVDLTVRPTDEAV